MSCFYHMLDSLDRTPNRWYLTDLRNADGQLVDERLFRYGRHATALQGLTIEIRPDYGQVELDFTFGPFDMPVVVKELGALLDQICPHDVQRIPLQVQGAAREYEILNVTHAIPCLDAKRSCVMWWTEEDGRPDKTGKPRMITELRIDSKLTADHKLFRIQDWEIALICSDEIRNLFESNGVTGVKFACVV